MKIHWHRRRFLLKICCIKLRRCFILFSSVTQNITFQINSVMLLKTMKDSQPMFMSRWISMNFRTFSLIDCRIKLRAPPLRELLKISLEVCFLIKLSAKDVLISPKLNNHFYQSVLMLKRKRISIKVLMRWSKEIHLMEITHISVKDVIRKFPLSKESVLRSCLTI